MRPIAPQLLARSVAGCERQSPCGIRVALQPLQIRPQIRSGPVTPLPVLLQRFGNNILQLDWDGGVQTPWRRRWAVQDGIEDYAGGISCNRSLARGHFIKDEPQGEQIRSFVEFLTANLLGGHVGYRAQRHAVAG